MLRIFQCALRHSAVTQTAQYKNIYVVSRSFARRKKSDPTPNDMERMGVLWEHLQNTEFGRKLDQLVDKKVEEGKDQNALVKETFDIKDESTKNMKAIKDPKKKTKSNKKTESFAGKPQARDLNEVEIDPELEQLFNNEMEKIDKSGPFAIFKILEEINKFTAKEDENSSTDNPDASENISNVNQEKKTSKNDDKKKQTFPKGKGRR